MIRPRLIARLDIKNHNVIKGVSFEGLRVVGNPEELCKKYYEQGADELVVIDAVASLYQANHLGQLLDYVTAETFVPVTAGGAVRSVDDAEALLTRGADKVAINTAAVKNPNLITEVADRFGAQAMVLSVQAKRIGTGRWEAYTDGGREHTGRDAIEWIEEGVQRGAGEVLVTSVDMDGTRKGFDIALARAVDGLVDVPIMFGGGAGGRQDLNELTRFSSITGIVCASAFHYSLF